MLYSTCSQNRKQSVTSVSEVKSTAWRCQTLSWRFMFVMLCCVVLDVFEGMFTCFRTIQIVAAVFGLL